MKLRRFLKSMLATQIAILAFAISALAQGASRPSPIQTKQTINDDTYREMVRVDRETIIPAEPETHRVFRWKQLGEDFKALQDTNNKMMAEAWAGEQLDYGHIAELLSEINAKAVRLNVSLALPEPTGEKKKAQPLNVTAAREFRAALLRMDHSIMGFVKNPLFQKPNVMEVGLATQAREDLDNIILLSTNLKKIANNFSHSGHSR